MIVPSFDSPAAGWCVGKYSVLSASVSSSMRRPVCLARFSSLGEVALHVAVVAFHADRVGHPPHLVAHLGAVQPVSTLMFSSGRAAGGGCAAAGAAHEHEDGRHAEPHHADAPYLVSVQMTCASAFTRAGCGAA